MLANLADILTHEKIAIFILPTNQIATVSCKTYLIMIVIAIIENIEVKNNQSRDNS